MKYHMLSHTGEKMFACKEFNYYCTIASRLKTHILIDLRDGTGRVEVMEDKD